MKLSVILLYKNNEVIGYVSSEDEAEMICNKYPNIVWNYIESYQQWILPKLKHLNFNTIQ